MPQRHYQELLNFLTRLLRDRETAADATQESYARLAAERGAELSPTAPAEPDAALRDRLFSTARQVVDDHQRDEHRERQGPRRRRGLWPADLHREPEHSAPGALPDLPVAPPEEQPAPPACEPEVAVAAGQAVESLLAAIEALPPRCREAFVLHRFDGLTQAEVAARMGVTVKMVERHVAQALQACRRAQERLESGEPTNPRPGSGLAYGRRRGGG